MTQIVLTGGWENMPQHLTTDTKDTSQLACRCYVLSSCVETFRGCA